MAESVYKIIEIVGTSPTSWERAAAAAVERASSGDNLPSARREDPKLLCASTLFGSS